jgi:hypothetical protein
MHNAITEQYTFPSFLNNVDNGMIMDYLIRLLPCLHPVLNLN